MSLAIVHSRAKLGIDAPAVTVEVHLSNGLPSFSMVGLPETAVKESKDRVRSALMNSHFDFPARRITVNLAPADLPKDGGRYDLAIAIGILVASDQLPASGLERYEFLGELALSGELRHCDGALPAALACTAEERSLIISAASASTAAISDQTEVFAAQTLLQVCAHLHRRQSLAIAEPPESQNPVDSTAACLSDVKGQHHAKRALEIAASGRHNVLFSGPPGTGKTMLASRLSGILPPLTQTEAIEVASVYSLSNQYTAPPWRQRPYRNPHHSSSAPALIGGGTQPMPGEISLAHKGVLFLDELPEFQRSVLEVLREPLEAGEIHIARAKAHVCFPADFQLVASMNPCPCGFYQSSKQACRCSPEQIRRYRQKISGPLLDRIDLQVPVQPLKSGEIRQAEASETSADVQLRVQACHQRQLERQHKTNSQLSGKELALYAPLDTQTAQWLDNAIEHLGLSSRAYHRVLRVARTLADMQHHSDVQQTHLREALSYRFTGPG